MIKLSDEKREKMVASANDGYTSAGIRAVYRQGLNDARNYYDAQIDKQAKTMDELWRLWEIPVSLKAREAIDKWNGRHTKDTLLFGYAVAFFLAASGTIKDGE